MQWAMPVTGYLHFGSAFGVALTHGTVTKTLDRAAVKIAASIARHVIRA